ncbi:MAG: zinc carboxypeptidase, partial [Flavobacteriaceae bacterium]|nr:zinc carboxypeptidase [Flavobacteriaceae bacterium]
MDSKFSVFIVLSFLSLTLFSQTVKTPKEFLGYELGEHFTPHHKVVAYFNHVAQNSNMVQYEQYGETNELRPLTLAYVSSAANLNNLETIRKNHLANAGIGSGSGADKAIVWLSYNVHGNEASATEAAIKTLHELVTEKQAWLNNTIVIIDPCINPDGRDRYANWYNQVAAAPYNTNPDAREHNEPWPGGRPNHYLFDLNRDWAWATQVESESRLKVYNKWLPHVHVDFHEQGINEPYYFAPAAEPFHEVITDWQREFQTQIGKNHAKYFDAEGWFYFTRERFDLFYPSYGDTYPTYVGSIGMTYEQAGHGRAGLGILNDEGDVLTLVDRIAHHHTTGLSTVEISSKNAAQLNSEFKKYFAKKNFKYNSYILQGSDSKKLELMELLDKHEIKYGFANKGVYVSGFDYSKNGNGSMKTSDMDLVVSTNQPKAKMVKVLFEPKAKLSDSITYDITAWSIPYAYGFKAIASNKIVSAKDGRVNTNNTTYKKGDYALTVTWDGINSADFLSELLQNDIRVRFTEKPFENSGKTFERGTLIITKGDNRNLDNFTSRLNKIIKKHQINSKIINTGFASKGVDIGSPDIKEIKNKKIAVLSGNRTSSLSYGEIQYFFEQEIHYPYTAINTDDFSISKLNKYHILILPNGFYGGMLGKEQMNDLKSWIRKGGKIIAIGNACRTFANQEGFGLKYNESKDDEKKEISDAEKLIAYDQQERESISGYITGAVFKSKV